MNRIRSKKTLKKLSKRMKKQWKNNKFREKMMKIRKHQWTEEAKRKLLITLNKRGITGIEKKIIKILEKYELPFKYCGDGSFIIHGLNPDFVNINGEKKLIEVFFEYFKIKQYGSIDKYKKQRYAIFRYYGFDTLFIDYQTLQSSKEEQIAELISNFQRRKIN